MFHQRYSSVSSAIHNISFLFEYWYHLALSISQNASYGGDALLPYMKPMQRMQHATCRLQMAKCTVSDNVVLQRFKTTRWLTSCKLMPRSSFQYS